MKRIIICFVIVLIGFISYMALTDFFMEKYFVSNNASVIRNAKGQIYIQDKANFLSLEALHIGRQIGKGDTHCQFPSAKIWEINGQPNHDWIAFNDCDEMSVTELYHKIQLHPYSINRNKITELCVTGSNDSEHMSASTSNADILKEFSASIKRKDSKAAFHKITNIRITLPLKVLTKEYKGIAFIYDITVSKDNKVYLSRVNSDNYTLPRKLFTNWIINNLRSL